MTHTTVPTQPAFCFITPISYLDMFAVASDRHLVLAHLVDRDERYRQFYKTRSAMGDYIMMDNSAYELHEPYSPEKLMHLAEQCGAHAIVLPDYPFQEAEVTIEAAREFAPQFKAAGYHTFFVPQSKKGDLEDWVRAYVWAANNPDIDIIGMSILGIPNALPQVDPAYARVVMTAILQSTGAFAKNKAHHYLGLNAGPGLEIPSLLRLNALTSIDSSGPVWSGIHGHAYSDEYDSLQAVKKLKSVVDFNIPRSKDNATIRRISNNVSMTNALFDNQEQEAWFAKE